MSEKQLRTHPAPFPLGTLRAFHGEREPDRRDRFRSFPTSTLNAQAVGKCMSPCAGAWSKVVHGKRWVDAKRLVGQLSCIGIDRYTRSPPRSPKDRLKLCVRRAGCVETAGARSQKLIIAREHKARTAMSDTFVLGCHKGPVYHEHQLRVSMDRHELRAKRAFSALLPANAAHAASTVTGAITRALRLAGGVHRRA